MLLLFLRPIFLSNMYPGRIIGNIILAGTGKDGTSLDPGMLYLILALVGFFILALILISLRKRLFPMFRLAYITLVYGRYSFEFQQFFKENNLRSPHNNCIRDEITMHFYCFFKKIKNAGEFQTKKNIEFGPIPFLYRYKKMLSTKGAPQCVNVAKFKDARVNVLGYNETIQGMKMKSIYYFINDLFVMGECIVLEKQRATVSPITSTLSVKYLGGIDLSQEVFYITDPRGNMINYENNGFSITVRYLFKGDKQTNEILYSVFGDGTSNGKFFMTALRNEELLNRF